MRTFIIFIVLAAIMISCGQADSSDSGKLMADTANHTQIQWIDSVVNFDTIRLGEKANVRFRFRNTGNKPLYLSEVKAGCGCTVANYTKGAIAPGNEGEVRGLFDSNKSHPGEVKKSIVVTANTKGETRHILSFAGWVREQK